ncbi:RICIN domain-containing protein [Nonomuraea sp. NPDC050643]|uniref:RICIN domain-containing protein n=1 Tax=Nonomuraea sp. NPDC050643 TaxID=3155660 RepID=UPI0033DBBCB7
MKRVLAILVLLAGGLVAWPASPANAVDYFQFRNAQLDNCLTLVGSAAHDGAWIGHYPCDGTDGQRWRVENMGSVLVCVDDAWWNLGQCTLYGTVTAFRIRSKVTDKCVDLSERSTRSGTRVHQWSCYNTDSQLWYFRGDDSSQKIMSVRAQNKREKPISMEPRWDDPNKAQIWTDNGSLLQTWRRVA